MRLVTGKEDYTDLTWTSLSSRSGPGTGRPDLSKDLYVILPQGLCTQCLLAFPSMPFYMLRISTPGLPQSRLNRSTGSALLLHTVHSKTWGGSRSTRPPTPPQCFPPGVQLFRMHPCSSSPITLLFPYCSSCPWPLPLLVLTVIFRYSLPCPPLLVYFRGEVKSQ